MRWPTHHVFGLGAALFFHLPPQGLALALLGSVLPDLLDQLWASLGSCFRSGRQRAFAAIHRGSSHWLGLWLLPFFMENSCPAWLLEALCALALGALSHLLLDALTPRGIPLLPFFSRPRLAIPLCRTGSAREAVFFLLCCLGLGFLLWRAWPEYLALLAGSL